ncbi:MAG: RluA family pseudouridine synthase [Alphaproteobacteria bacterium]|nr:RluA family pseudouridine synthase [Alphaproteobacteria bacterium]
MPIGPGVDGMRLDRWLSLRFADRSRTFFARALREGMIRDGRDVPLAASWRVRGGEVLRVYVPGIAPTSGPPPFPTILYEDDRVVAIDKPPGLLAHPSGTAFAWGVISLAKARWPDARVDLVHRLDKDTSGVMLLTLDLEANRHLKEAVVAGAVHKEYEALVRGMVPWPERRLEGPIGPEDGEIRIKMAVRPDGLPARTDATVLGRRATLSHLHLVLHTGRTHQIRLHLADAGFPVLGDRLYGVPHEVFLDLREGRATLRDTIAIVGAPRQALHSRRVTFPHPDGRTLTVEAPFAADLVRWWERPEVLPYDE